MSSLQFLYLVGNRIPSLFNISGEQVRTDVKAFIYLDNNLITRLISEDGKVFEVGELNELRLSGNPIDLLISDHINIEDKYCLEKYLRRLRDHVKSKRAKSAAK